MIAAQRFRQAAVFRLLDTAAFYVRARQIAGKALYIIWIQSRFLQQLTRREDADNCRLLRRFERPNHGIHHELREIAIRRHEHFIRCQFLADFLRFPAGQRARDGLVWLNLSTYPPNTSTIFITPFFRIISKNRYAFCKRTCFHGKSWFISFSWAAAAAV